MTGFIMRPRVLTPRVGDLTDTFNSCAGQGYSAYRYVHGDRRAHFAVPATITLPVTLIDVYLVEHCIQLMAEFFNESSVYG